MNKSMYESKKSEMYDMADVPTYEAVVPYRRQNGSKYRLVVLVGGSIVTNNRTCSTSDAVSTAQHQPDDAACLLLSQLSKAMIPMQPQHSDSVHPVQPQLEPVALPVCTMKPGPMEHTLEFTEYGKCKGNYYRTSLDSICSVLSKNKVCLLDVQPHEEDFQEMLSTAQTMETQYGHLFEKVIVNDDLNVAFSKLQLALKKVETETHWIPVNWTHS